MFNVGKFLQCAMTDTVIILIDNGLRHMTTVNKIDKKYDDKTFTCWEMQCGRLTLYLD